VMTLIQLAFVVMWVHTYQSALFCSRALFYREIWVLGYGVLAAVVGGPQTGLSLACEVMLWIDIASLGLAFWCHDSRLFPPKETK